MLIVEVPVKQIYVITNPTGRIYVGKVSGVNYLDRSP